MTLKVYATLTDFQQRTGRTKEGASDPKKATIESALAQASRMIDFAITGREDIAVYDVTTLNAEKVIYSMGMSANGLQMDYTGRRIVFPGPIISITEVKNNNVTITENIDYIVAHNYIQSVSSFTDDYQYGVAITGSFGYATVPDNIVALCVTIAEVLSGLGTRTYIDAMGQKTDVTRDNIPKYVSYELRKRKMKIV